MTWTSTIQWTHSTTDSCSLKELELWSAIHLHFTYFDSPSLPSFLLLIALPPLFLSPSLSHSPFLLPSLHLAPSSLPLPLPLPLPSPSLPYIEAVKIIEEGRAPHMIQWEGAATYDQKWSNKSLAKVHTVIRT